MPALFQRYKLAFVLIAGLLLVKFMLLPWSQWVSQNAEAIKSHRFTLHKLGNLDERRAALQQVSEQLMADYQALLGILADNNPAANIAFQRHIEAIALKHGAEITNRMIKDIVNDPVPHIPAVYYFRGRPESLLAVLAELEGSQPKLLVSRVTLNQSGSSVNSLVATVELALYLKPVLQEGP